MPSAGNLPSLEYSKRVDLEENLPLALCQTSIIPSYILNLHMEKCSSHQFIKNRFCLQ